VKPVKLVSIGIALLVIQACSRPIEIEGHGDIMSASGSRTCLLENFQAADDVCSKNYAIGAYRETYSARPRTGWKFDHWENYCTNATPPNYECSFDISAAGMFQFRGQSAPPLKAVFTPIETDFHEITNWTHSWDVKDAVMYVPTPTEQAYWPMFGLDDTPRITSIPDRGTNNMPLLRDDGNWTDFYGLFAGKLPGPLLIENNPQYNGRPSLFADVMIAGRSGSKESEFTLHSMLSPNANPMPEGSATFFNPPNGYQAPYWLATLSRYENVAVPVIDSVTGLPATARSLSAFVDSFRGVDGAGPTWGGSMLVTHYGVACFGPNDETGVYPYFHWAQMNKPLSDGPQSMIAMLYVGVGIKASFMELNWREAGEVRTLRQYFTLGSKPNNIPYPFEELFIGYAENMHTSALGIKLGTPTEEELTAVREWGVRYLPANQ